MYFPVRNNGIPVYRKKKLYTVYTGFDGTINSYTVENTTASTPTKDVISRVGGRCRYWNFSKAQFFFCIQKWKLQNKILFSVNSWWKSTYFFLNSTHINVFVPRRRPPSPPSPPPPRKFRVRFCSHTFPLSISHLYSFQVKVRSKRL